MKARMQWFNDAKFGMFIHWGPYSQLGVEASWPIMAPGFARILDGRRVSQQEYEKCAQTFNPVEFDAANWVRTARAAGMRYMVFTTKHHDGYCMFDAPGTDYKITNSPFGRDITAELAAACTAEGIRLGFYYSPPDMHHPGYRDTTQPAVKNWEGQPERPEWADYLDYMESHLRHLLTAYGDVDLLWFDGLMDQNKYDPERFHRVIREIRPDIVINDRLGDLGDYTTPEQGIPDGVPVVEQMQKAEISTARAKALFRMMGWPVIRGIIKKRYSVPTEDPRPLTKYNTEPFPPEERFLPWETCITMNRTWAYNPGDTIWKSADLLTRILVKAASKGGNYLLNVGPDPLGRLPQPALERIDAIGQWMEKNGEAIYGSTYGPPVDSGNLVLTRKGGCAYAFITTEPSGTRLPLPDTCREYGDAVILDSGDPIELEKDDGGIRIVLPEGLDFAQPIVIKLK